jgi:IS5 family transposase
MSIEPTLLSPLAALVGAFMGAGASLVAAIYRQRRQDHLQRVAGEMAKRETVYADFVIHAANLLLRAYTTDEIELTGDEQRLMGLVNRMRFFAPRNVVAAAEAALRAIVEISLKPRIEVRQLATHALSNSLDDPLLEFSLVCKADLGNVHRTVA